MTSPSPRLTVAAIDGTLRIDRPVPDEGVADSIAALLALVEQDFGGRRLLACSHRIAGEAHVLASTLFGPTGRKDWPNRLAWPQEELSFF
ncbi:hypothetical protein [uncultured Pleomorphomonas sp.]|nr:hypothetical protein [uncultured Pleomorphomonas sp.]